MREKTHTQTAHQMCEDYFFFSIVLSFFYFFHFLFFFFSIFKLVLFSISFFLSFLVFVKKKKRSGDGEMKNKSDLQRK